jgi:hypothetical protein
LRERERRERERKKNEEVCGCAFEKKHHEREMMERLSSLSPFITYIAVP